MIMQCVNFQKNRLWCRQNKDCHIKPAEVKLILLILYYSIVSLFILTVTSKAISDENIAKVSGYFQCEATGVESQCSISVLQTDKIVQEIGFDLLNTMPWVYFIFLFDFSKICCRTTRNSVSQQTMSLKG